MQRGGRRTKDRDALVSCDGSVTRVLAMSEVCRRSRGYAWPARRDACLGRQHTTGVNTTQPFRICGPVNCAEDFVDLVNTDAPYLTKLEWRVCRGCRSQRTFEVKRSAVL